MLTEHAVLEVDGQNVVGMKDNDIGKVIEDAPATVTITIMPGITMCVSTYEWCRGPIAFELDLLQDSSY